jgi:site-specific DNA-methyltransferase (adenine-specific)
MSTNNMYYEEMFKHNTLIYGDNLPTVRKFPNACIDLIYLDPPFNSNKNYSIFFKEKTGVCSASQMKAFTDTWHWDEKTQVIFRNLQMGEENIRRLMQSLEILLGSENDMMAYLVMMTVRLIEFRRILKPKGSIYLHCDVTASHYIKIVMDAIFNPKNFRNEIVWKRKTGQAKTAHKFATATDSIFFYSRTKDVNFEPQYIPLKELSEEEQKEIKDRYNLKTPEGRLYHTDNLANPSYRPTMKYVYKGCEPPYNGWDFELETMEEWDGRNALEFPKKKGGRLMRRVFFDEYKGKPIQSLWDEKEVQMLSANDKERLGYPTQKPVALLERIIKASCPPDGIVLDPFCGCGTTIQAAHKLRVKWIGIDITHLAIAVIKKRLRTMLCIEGMDYEIRGEPVDTEGMNNLSNNNKYQFQSWAGSLLPNFVPIGRSEDSPDGKKGADQGVDGYIPFEEADGSINKIVVQVKTGHVGSNIIRDLVGTVNNTKSAMGILATLNEPTKAMKQAMFKAGD